jgi:hypothetical protein
MGDNKAAYRPAMQIDAPMLWAAVRGGEILYAVIFAKMAYLSRGTESFVEDVISTTGVLLILALYVHRVVTGRADSEGIHYRRYFRWRTLPWSGVQEIQWKGARLRVLIKGKRKPKAVLEFLLNPLKAIGPYWGQRLGAEVEPPEIFTRIRSLSIEPLPTMSTAPPHSKWVMRFFFSVTILFFAIMLMRLLSATK